MKNQMLQLLTDVSARISMQDHDLSMQETSGHSKISKTRHRFVGCLHAVVPFQVATGHADGFMADLRP